MPWHVSLSAVISSRVVGSTARLEMVPCSAIMSVSIPMAPLSQSCTKYKRVQHYKTAFKASIRCLFIGGVDGLEKECGLGPGGKGGQGGRKGW